MGRKGLTHSLLLNLPKPPPKKRKKTLGCVMATTKIPTYAVGSDRLLLNGAPPTIISPGNVRSDGRGLHQCRSAFMQTGAVNAAAGSAYAEFGQTKVIVAVFGPRESKKAQAFSDIGRLNCNVSFTTFATTERGKAGQGLQEKEYSSMLYKALEGAVALHTFPKTTVDVFALVIQSGGGDLPVTISCASLALADAGIVMHDLVSAMSVGCFGNMLLLDSTLEEEGWHDGGLMISTMPSRNEITQLILSGEWPNSRLSEALELCVDACKKLGAIMRDCLKEAALRNHI